MTEKEMKRKVVGGLFWKILDLKTVNLYISVMTGIMICCWNYIWINPQNSSAELFMMVMASIRKERKCHACMDLP